MTRFTVTATATHEDLGQAVADAALALEQACADEVDGQARRGWSLFYGLGEQRFAPAWGGTEPAWSVVASCEVTVRYELDVAEDYE